jgi:hypothetical protein
MAPLGGGVFKNISHRHFWFVVITFSLIVGGLWSWHRLEIRQAVRAEQDQQFQAEQTAQNKVLKKAPAPSAPKP